MFINNELEEREKENNTDKKGRRKKKKDPNAIEGATALVTRDALEILNQHEGNLGRHIYSVIYERYQVD